MVFLAYIENEEQLNKYKKRIVKRTGEYKWCTRVPFLTNHNSYSFLEFPYYVAWFLGDDGFSHLTNQTKENLIHESNYWFRGSKKMWIDKPQINQNYIT